MNTYNEFIPLFFDVFAKSFSEEQFFATIQKGIPSTIANQLTNDGQPDIGLSKDVTVEELLIPLSGRKMPKENLRSIRNMLSYYLIEYNITYESEYIDPYKIIYIASLYIHCYIASGNCWEGEVSMAAVGGLIAKASVQPQISHEMRVQVLKYLASVIPTVAMDQTMYEFVNEESIYDERPYIGLCISFSIIYCAIFSQSLHFIEVPRTSGLPIPLNRSHGQPDERTVTSGYRLLATIMEDMERVIDQRLNLFFASLGWRRTIASALQSSSDEKDKRGRVSYL